MNEYHVNAFWDTEAEVWVATSEDVPGLVTEAETMEMLTDKLPAMIADLMKPSENDSFWLGVSQSALDKIWNNPADDIYEQLLTP